MFGPFRLFFVLGLVGTAVGLFFGVKGAVTAKHAVDSVNRKGGDGKSLFHAGNLDHALDKVRAQIGADGQVLQLAIYPGYLEVDASTGSEDRGRSFRIQEDGRVQAMPLTLNGPGRLKDNIFPLADVHGATVERLAEQAAAKEHTDLDGVTHVVATIQPDSGDPGIAVYLADQRYWRASMDGRGLSNPDIQARKALDGAGDVAACLQAAGADAARMAACTK